MTMLYPKPCCNEVCNKGTALYLGLLSILQRMEAKDEVSSDFLSTMLGIQDINVVLHTSKMRWLGHIDDNTGWIVQTCKEEVVGQKRHNMGGSVEV